MSCKCWHGRKSSRILRNINLPGIHPIHRRSMSLSGLPYSSTPKDVGMGVQNLAYKRSSTAGSERNQTNFGSYEALMVGNTMLTFALPNATAHGSIINWPQLLSLVTIIFSKLTLSCLGCPTHICPVQSSRATAMRSVHRARSTCVVMLVHHGYVCSRSVSISYSFDPLEKSCSPSSCPPNANELFLHEGVYTFRGIEPSV